jgi:hypothetical protein
MDEIEFRRAQALDLPAIVALLADDPIGATREAPSTPPARPTWTLSWRSMRIPTSFWL